MHFEGEWTADVVYEKQDDFFYSGVADTL